MAIVAMTPTEYVLRENARREREEVEALSEAIRPFVEAGLEMFFEKRELENENLKLQNLKLRKELGLE